MNSPKIYLASSSPRRVNLLKMLGIPFDQIIRHIDETNDYEIDPVSFALNNAELKARSFVNKIREGYILGADTIVVLDDVIFGKPSSIKQANGFLAILSGRTHSVITGVAVLNGQTNVLYSDHAITKVTFRDISKQEIEAYVATGECLDKAGAYAIQGRGALFISSIQGCHSNVIGLPLVTMNNLFERHGINLFQFWSGAYCSDHS